MQDAWRTVHLTATRNRVCRTYDAWAVYAGRTVRARLVGGQAVCRWLGQHGDAERVGYRAA